MNRPNPATGAVLRGADAGLYALPAEVAELHAARQHLTAQLAEPTPDRNAPRETYARAVRAAALAGGALPDPAEVFAAEQDSAARAYRTDVVRQVLEALTGDLNTAVSDLAESILVEHLRPAWQAGYDQARAAVAVFLPYGSTQGALFAAPEKARKAFASLAGHVDTMLGCSRVVDGLRLCGYRPQLDELDLFRSVKDVLAVWPDLATDRRSASHTLAGKPWPDALAERVMWSVQTGAELWLPTPHEQDQQWSRCYGERVAEQARGRWAATAMHAMSGTAAGRPDSE